MAALEPRDFGLNRFDLLLDPVSEPNLYAGRKDLLKDLKRRIDRSHKTGSAMHTVLWGPYGTGKTHTLHYLKNYIVDKTYDSFIIHLTCPPIRKNVVELYQEIIAKLGQAFLYSLLTDVWEYVSPKFQEKNVRTDAEKIEIIDRFVQHRDLATVVLAYQKPGEEIKYHVWNWFSGEKCSAKQKEMLGIIRDNSDEKTANRTLLTIISVYGEINRLKGQKKLLILMIDELESLKPLGEAFDFIELFRRFAEYKRFFTMLLSYTAATAEEIPVLNAAQVRDRIGFPENYVSISTFDEVSAKNFVADLLSLLRPPRINLRQKISAAQKVTGQIVSEKYYPFTEEAIDRIITGITATGEFLSPRNIEMALTSAIGDALLHIPPTKIIS